MMALCGIRLDTGGVFALPVSRLQAPDYYDIIKHPMDWATMGEKLDRHEYLTGTDFQVSDPLLLPLHHISC